MSSSVGDGDAAALSTPRSRNNSTRHDRPGRDSPECLDLLEAECSR